MKHILQKSPRGCGLAVLQMVTDLPEEAIRGWFSHVDFVDHGIHAHALEGFLAENGYAYAKIYRCRREGVERVPWPPLPFADKHIITVEVAPASPCTHYIVMDRSGKIYDPLTLDDRKLSDYHQIYNFLGVFKI